MQTRTAPPAYLPFGLGGPRSFRGLTVVPLYAEPEPVFDYVGLDEAMAGGLTVTEVSEAGAVESLLVANPLAITVLLYEGEELVGAKQDPLLERSILVPAGSRLAIPAKWAEKGRRGYRSRRFVPVPRAASPDLRRLRHDTAGPSQHAVSGERSLRSRRGSACYSETARPRRCPRGRAAPLDEYLQALPGSTGRRVW